MKREIIRIDEEKCTGCGLCIPGCPEGAIQLIDGKARLISDLFCDGLGACIGECPEEAITVEVREAEPYDERKVMENIVKQGENTILAHLNHLKDHGQTEYYNQALKIIEEKKMDIAIDNQTPAESLHGCPGAQSQSFHAATESPQVDQASQLAHWPIQLHLISPRAPHYQGADVLLSADCVAFSMGNFHSLYLKGKTLAIACPKLDEGQEIYSEKIKALIDEANINTLTVMIMQVPCCHGLVGLAQSALESAKRKIPIKVVVTGIQGQILQEDWL